MPASGWTLSGYAAPAASPYAWCSENGIRRKVTITWLAKFAGRQPTSCRNGQPWKPLRRPPRLCLNPVKQSQYPVLTLWVSANRQCGHQLPTGSISRWSMRSSGGLLMLSRISHRAASFHPSWFHRHAEVPAWWSGTVEESRHLSPFPDSSVPVLRQEIRPYRSYLGFPWIPAPL